MKKLTKNQLSFSSSKLLQTCTKKYWHYKVNNTPKDPDAEDDLTAFNVGKAFHQVLEKTNHIYDEVKLYERLVEAVKMHQVEEHQALIHAMLLKRYKLHRKSGLEAAVCEVELSDDKTISYVDVILWNNVTGEWYIGDLKTAATIYEKSFITLEHDPQLTLYSHFAQEIADNISYLFIERFKGVKYMVTSKPRLKQKNNESYQDYVLRLAKSCRSIEITIPKERLDIASCYKRHEQLYQMSLELQEGKLEPMCNYNACFEYFRPCAWFSQCHGGTASEVQERLEVLE